MFECVNAIINGLKSVCTGIIDLGNIILEADWSIGNMFKVFVFLLLFGAAVLALYFGFNYVENYFDIKEVPVTLQFDNTEKTLDNTGRTWTNFEKPMNNHVIGVKIS